MLNCLKLTLCQISKPLYHPGLLKVNDRQIGAKSGKPFIYLSVHFAVKMFIAVHSLSGIMRFLAPSEDIENTEDSEDREDIENKHNLSLLKHISQNSSIISWEKDEIEVSFISLFIKDNYSLGAIGLSLGGGVEIYAVK